MAKAHSLNLAGPVSTPVQAHYTAVLVTCINELAGSRAAAAACRCSWWRRVRFRVAARILQLQARPFLSHTRAHTQRARERGAGKDDMIEQIKSRVN